MRANSSMMSISRRCDWKRVYLVSFFEFLHSIERSSMDYIIFAVGSFFTHETAFYGDILCSHCVSNVLIGKWVFWWFGDVIPKMVKLTRMLQQQWAHEHSLKIWYGTAKTTCKTTFMMQLPHLIISRANMMTKNSVLAVKQAALGLLHRISKIILNHKW